MGRVSGGGAHPIRKRGTDLIVIADAETACGWRGGLGGGEGDQMGVGGLM